MTNLQYLEQFFKKHGLKGKLKVKYTNGQNDDDYMSDLIFESGDTMNIHDVIFDIESDLSPDVVGQWLKYKKENNEDISLMDWISTDNHYVPEGIDYSSMDEYRIEIETMMNGIKDGIEQLFTLKDDGDSDEDE
jgi:hypothetical protein